MHWDGKRQLYYNDKKQVPYSRYMINDNDECFFDEENFMAAAINSATGKKYFWGVH